MVFSPRVLRVNTIRCRLGVHAFVQQTAHIARVSDLTSSTILHYFSCSFHSSIPNLQMAKTSRIFLLTCLVTLSSLSSLLANPMQEALNSVHCVLRGIKFKVRVTGCYEREVSVNSCLGTCLSFSTPTGYNYNQVESCTCCQQVKTKKVDVGLWCKDKNNPSKDVRYFHQIETATECACASCWCCWAIALSLL